MNSPCSPWLSSSRGGHMCGAGAPALSAAVPSRMRAGRSGSAVPRLPPARREHDAQDLSHGVRRWRDARRWVSRRHSARAASPSVFTYPDSMILLQSMRNTPASRQHSAGSRATPSRTTSTNRPTMRSSPARLSR